MTAKMKWFEKKWFVNLKTGTRQRICFLFIAVIAAIIGVTAAIIFLSLKVPNALVYAIIFIIVSVLELVFALILANINTFLITDPMIKNDRCIVRFSTGHFETSDFIRDRDYVTAKYQDEIGVFSSKLKDLMMYLRNLNTAVRQISKGDLTVDVPICSEKDQIGNGLTDLVNNFHVLVTTIATAIDQVTSGANLVSDSSLSLSQGATHQASSVQELTASLEQIAQQTRLNAQNAEKANELAKCAKMNAAEGNAQMKDMLKAMDDISISSSNINKIIKVIDDIAFQTNILALNAAVEAARAGQHGKGFAVVAEEVRNLAGKSANAARETTDMIENSIKKVNVGTKIANQTAKALDEIVSQVENAADLINSITLSSVEQTNGIEQINIGINQVSQVIQTNAATAQESAAASEELSSQAAQLKEHVGQFKLKVSIRDAGPKASAKFAANSMSAPAAKISLSSGDFGKY